MHHDSGTTLQYGEAKCQQILMLLLRTAGCYPPRKLLKILNVSRPYVVMLADSGQLVAARAEDGKLLIPVTAVEAYRAEQTARSRYDRLIRRALLQA